MSQPIESLARVASSPAQAKIFVAMLAAEASRRASTATRWSTSSPPASGC